MTSPRNCRTGPWLLAPLLLFFSVVVVGCGGCANQKNDEPDRPPTEVRSGSLIDQLRGPDELRDEYAPPTTDEYVRLTQLLEELYPRLFEGATQFDNLGPRLAEAGLRLRTVERGGETWLVLFEGGETWRGTGGYIFRTGDATETSPVILQAPHSFYDMHTGVIAEQIFEATDARALFFNSLHRYRGATHQRDRDQVHPSDLSHDTSSFFHTIMTAYLRHRPETLIVQLHGFASDNLEERNVGVVLSDGTSEPNPDIGRLDVSLGAFLEDWDVAVYPDDTGSYAATANAQGRWIRNAGSGHFVHLELIRDLRDAMKDGEVDLAGFGRAVVDTTEGFSE